MTLRASLALAPLVLAVAASPALAHRLDMDLRRLPGGRVRVEVYYQDGRPAAGAEVIARGAGGAEVWRGRADPEGAAEFAAPEGMALDLEALHEGGHRAARALPAGDPGDPSSRARGSWPLGRLALGLAVIAILGAAGRRALRRRRAS